MRNRDIGGRMPLLTIISAIIVGIVVQGVAWGQAPEPRREPAKIAERPWAAVWIASLARVLAACDVIYDSIDRPDLADSLEDRQVGYREFLGIDRTRPLGMMWTWDDENEPAATIFLPVHQIDDLMKTATFSVVDYHRVTENQYEIERPGAPYHVLVRNGYALFGEEVPAIAALRDSPERMTRELKEKYDIVFTLDQRQVPRSAKQVWIDSIRKQLEPWLQPQDAEPIETAAVRQALGKSLLDLMEMVIEDVQTVTVGGRIDRKTYQLQLDLTLHAEPGSTMAAELNRLVIRRSEFSALVNREASAGLAINWPLTMLGKDLPGAGGNNAKAERLDAGVQLIGSDWSDMTLIAGIRGKEATALNAALPHLLTRMEKSADFTAVTRNVGKHRNVDLHRIVPARIPDFLSAITQPEIEIVIGQNSQTVWLAAGRAETLIERLMSAINIVEDTPAEKGGSVMQARLSVGKWPNMLPLVDPEEARLELGKSKDGFTLSIQPIQNGLKIQFAAEEGLLRVIGRHWARQVDQLGGQ